MMSTSPHIERPRNSQWSTARRIGGLAIAAAAAQLALAGLAGATPVNFTLSGATGSFNPPPTTVTFAGTFTFDSATLSETNIAITATPTGSSPLIVSNYTTTDGPHGSLCDGFVGPDNVCFTDQADDAAVAFEFSNPLNGTPATNPIIVLSVSGALAGEPDMDLGDVTGAAVVAASEPSTQAILAAALGLWLLRRRTARRRSLSQFPDAA